MKKPFISLRTSKDVIKLIICIILCAFAVSLFSADDSIAVFGGESARPNSLYGLAGSIV